MNIITCYLSLDPNSKATDSLLLFLIHLQADGLCRAPEVGSAEKMKHEDVLDIPAFRSLLCDVKTRWLCSYKPTDCYFHGFFLVTGPGHPSSTALFAFLGAGSYRR